jgi:putative flippase GtrA
VRRFLLFGIGSTVGAAIDFTIGLVLLGIGLPAWLALGLAMTVSANIVYVLHQKVTFGDLHSRDLHAGRLAAFLTSTLLVYLFRLAAFEGLKAIGWTDAMALAAALVASLSINFAVSRSLIFSRPGRRG